MFFRDHEFYFSKVVDWRKKTWENIAKTGPINKTTLHILTNHLTGDRLLTMHLQANVLREVN